MNIQKGLPRHPSIIPDIKPAEGAIKRYCGFPHQRISLGESTNWCNLFVIEKLIEIEGRIVDVMVPKPIGIVRIKIVMIQDLSKGNL